MYNVLDLLRRGEPLTPKDKVIHEQGLVSVLRQIHDDLDAAVLAAYGWEDLIAVPNPSRRVDKRSAVHPPNAGPVVGEVDCAALVHPTTSAPEVAAVELEETILLRLVALNAERAAEERYGLVRWLRPDFQNPGSAGVFWPGTACIPGAPGAAPGTPASGSGGVPPPGGRDARAPGGRDAPAPWPKSLPDQIQALRAALATQAGPARPADLAQGFARAPRAKVAELLDTLANLGLARRLDDGRYLSG